MSIIVSVVAAGMLVHARRTRLRREQAFQSTISANVEKAIFQLDYQSAQLKFFHRWFAVPIALMMGLMLVKSEFEIADLWGKSAIILAISFALSMLVCYAANRMERRCRTLPERESLIAIREKLQSEPASSMQ